ncbi:sigma-70 family RNA polymerase sigma factor [Actinokineospora sp. NBRC 105648]|uniref:RNA polymerase sigma factor n=1 Tax=Actinokineospora sp. NBRC 105648 TaxID=3032206 RepID=UPI0024A1187B|nr:sigma-70 family RNA polymerase sigma factor [Actinokineospora sp. NBRC 105648]GLZ38012.1 siderophore-interacting protein [Actinokineospora sp. NBRC 105648]
MYEQHYERVLAFALRRVSPDHAPEVVDETFLIAWRRRLDLPDPPVAWLLVTARNIIYDHGRRTQRQDAVSAELARCRELHTSGSVEAEVVGRLTMMAALLRLPEHEREALILTVWDGLPYRQAAAVAGCSITAFTVRVHRARRHLATALEDLDAAMADQTLDKVESPEVGRG